MAYREKLKSKASFVVLDLFYWWWLKNILSIFYTYTLTQTQTKYLFRWFQVLYIDLSRALRYRKGSRALRKIEFQYFKRQYVFNILHFCIFKTLIENTNFVLDQLVLRWNWSKVLWCAYILLCSNSIVFLAILFAFKMQPSCIPCIVYVWMHFWHVLKIIGKMVRKWCNHFKY